MSDLAYYVKGIVVAIGAGEDKHAEFHTSRLAVLPMRTATSWMAYLLEYRQDENAMPDDAIPETPGSPAGVADHPGDARACQL